jgi:nifR3 family TIM-barrel protein
MKLKLKPLKIGKLTIKNPILLAPMVDITDLPYRIICKTSGASMCYTEMLYIDAIIHKNPKTQKLMRFSSKEKPIGIQITGNNLEHFRAAIPYLKKYSLVDLNCGCPSERITGSESGSYLLNNPKLISDIIKILKAHKLTVTAKIRLGYNKNNVLEIAKTIEEAGADALTVHPRLATQGYNVKADWSQIKLIKQQVKIPVIANGDILKEEDAKKIIEQTGCDGIMIARGAIGDPLIFKRINHYLKTGKKLPFSIKDNLKLLQLYLKLCKKHKFNDLSRIKRLSCKFIKSFEGASNIRNQIMSLQFLNEIEKLIKKI